MPRRAALPRLRRPGFDFLDDAAADNDRVGVRRDRPGAGRIANAEADADGQRDVAADLGELADHLGDVEMAGPGDALERHVVDVPARHAPHGDDPRLGGRRRQQEDRRQAVARSGRRRNRPPLRADSRPRSRRRRRRRARAAAKRRNAHRLDRIGVSHEHDRRRCVLAPECRDHGEHVASSRCLAPARVPTRAGSPDRRPSDPKTAPPARSTSAPAATSACSSCTVTAGDGSPAVTYGTSAVRPAARSLAKVVSMRFKSGGRQAFKRRCEGSHSGRQ